MPRIFVPFILDWRGYLTYYDIDNSHGVACIGDLRLIECYDGLLGDILGGEIKETEADRFGR
jgi:hypothetical protein